MIFHVFLSNAFPVCPGCSQQASVREAGGARDVQEHAGVPEDCQGHPQTSRNMFGENRNFMIFSPNLKKFWSKNVHFPKDFL